MALHGDRDVLTEAQPSSVEDGVDANAATLELVELRRATLVEVIEGNAVRVDVAPARDFHVVIANRRGTEGLVPPIGTGTARHDQTVRVGILAVVDGRRATPCVGRGHGAGRRVEECWNG